MRAGAEYFLEPSEPAQRRYEAMRAYFVDGLTASEVATRFGYSPASVHQMATELRAGSAQYFRSSKPGPGRHAKLTACATACSSYAPWTARWRRSPPS